MEKMEILCLQHDPLQLWRLQVFRASPNVSCPIPGHVNRFIKEKKHANRKSTLLSQTKVTRAKALKWRYREDPLTVWGMESHTSIFKQPPAFMSCRLTRWHFPNSSGLSPCFLLLHLMFNSIFFWKLATKYACSCSVSALLQYLSALDICFCSSLTNLFLILIKKKVPLQPSHSCKWPARPFVLWGNFKDFQKPLFWLAHYLWVSTIEMVLLNF